jgi:hypothetical protein
MKGLDSSGVPTHSGARRGPNTHNHAQPSITLPSSDIWETRSVQLRVRLPRELAAEVERVQESDPEFLSRIVMYGLTRRSIYHHLREQNGQLSPLSAASDDQPLMI